MKNFKKILLIALLAAFGARLYVSFFVDGFIITFTAIILAVALYFDDELNPVLLGITVAIVSPSLRFFADLILHGQAGLLLSKVYPDIFFYMTYGIVFYLCQKIFKEHYKRQFYIVAFLSDFLANFLELLIRTQIFDFEWQMMSGIFFVAIGRTFIIMVFVYMAINYSNLLVKQEHEKRYQYLMMMTSRFRSEIYFLHKNMRQIENLVGLSHQLRQEADEGTRTLTLELSKGMHEVKKDYLRAIKGLEEIYDGKLNLEELSLKDLFKIIEVNTKAYLKQNNKAVTINFKCKVDCHVRYHFYFMTLIRNLTNNAIEACDQDGKIDVLAYENKETIEVIISDDGHGIPEDAYDFIFNTGYSTKFNEASGDIYRGLGLTLVKDLIEKEFLGTLDFESSDQGTKFFIRIKKTTLEKGIVDEVLLTR